MVQYLQNHVICIIRTYSFYDCLDPKIQSGLNFLIHLKKCLLKVGQV